MPLDDFDKGVALVVERKALKVLFTPSRGSGTRMSVLPQTMQGAMLLGPEEIEIRDVPVPRPGEGEMLLKVEAATTCGTDVKVFRRGGHPRMLKAPTLFGHEMAGRVAALGPGVRGYAVGDAIVVANSAPCLQCEPCRRGRENLCEDLHYLNGAFAEYLLVPRRFVERNIHRIPDGLSFERAALAEPLACVLHGIDACELDRYGALGPVEILIFGGGPIGLLFVGGARAHGPRCRCSPIPIRAGSKSGVPLGAAKRSRSSAAAVRPHSCASKAPAERVSGSLSIAPVSPASGRMRSSRCGREGWSIFSAAARRAPRSRSTRISSTTAS